MKNFDKKVLHTLIDALSVSYPDKVAIEQEDHLFTYKDLVQASNRIAHALIEEGVSQGEVVAVYLPASFDYVSSIIGINKCGGIFMPIDMNYPKFRIQYVLQKTKPQRIITNTLYKDTLIVLLREIWSDEFDSFELLITDKEISAVIVGKEEIGASRNLQAQHTEVTVEVSGEDGNYLMFTSGSTGKPKAIEGRHKSLSHFIHWQISEFGLDANVRVSQLAPLLFDVSLRDIFVPLVACGTLVIPPDNIKGYPEKLLRWANSKKITMMHMVPSVFRIFTKCLKGEAERNLASMQYIFLAGEPIYGRDVNEWFSLVGEQTALVNLYGPSETTLAKLFYKVPFITADKNAIIPLGEPIANTLILILKNGRLCDFGEVGEIFIKTPFASRGYYKDKALTDASFIQNPLHDVYEDIIYRTGDLGRYRTDRKVEYVGRADSLVKIRGNRVELLEVEKTIRQFPGVSQVVVMALPNANSEQQIVCYHLEEDGLNISKLREYLKDFLPEYMHPSYSVCLKEFPLNLNGKINKQLLPKPEEMLYERIPYEAAQTSMEMILSDIWAEILHLKKVGIHHSFFDLGGNSLSGTRVVSLVCKITRKELSLKDFFDHPTICQLAAVIEQKEALPSEEIPALHSQPNYPLSAGQKQLWALDKIEDEKGTFNIHLACRIDGPLDLDVLNKAFQLLIRRHEILRTILIEENGEPRQIILDPDEYPFALDYSENFSLSEQELKSVLLTAASRSFDLSKGPLWQVVIVACGVNQVVFSLTLHHIICDAWSVEILLNEVIGAYHGLLNDFKNYSCGESLNIQYKDYAAWQNSKLNGSHAQTLKKYWVSLFEQGVPDFRLGSERSRPSQKSYKGRTLKKTFKRSVKEELHVIGNQQGTSLFMNLLSAVGILLYRYSGKQDILVGSPFVGRQHPDLKNQIGFYVNILPLYIKVNREDKVGDLMQKIKYRTLEAFEHQLYPFHQLVSDLQINRTADRSPMFNIRMELHTAPEIVHTPGNLKVTQIEIEEQISQYDLTFRFLETADDLSLALNYSTELYSNEYIEYLMLHVQEILGQLVRHTHSRVGDLQLTGIHVNDVVEKQVNTFFDFS